MVGARSIAKRRRGVSMIGCLLQVALVAGLAYLATMVADDVMAYYRYRDAMKQEARFAATRSDEEMRRRLVAFTDSVKLPIAAKNVNIVRDESRIRIWAEYDTEVRVPYFSRTFHLRPSAEKTF